MTDTGNTIYLGAFLLSGSLTLKRAANGGWVVSQVTGLSGDAPSIIGAFSNSKDMLAALEKALLPIDTPGGDEDDDDD